MVLGLNANPSPEQQQLLELLRVQADAIERVTSEIQAQTLQLQQAIEYQAMLHRITDRVRDSWDETQILQTVVQELGSILSLSGCDTAQYDREIDATVLYRYVSAEKQEAIIWREMAQTVDLKELRLQGQTTQFCCLRDRRIVLFCPILDGHDLLGDLRLYRVATAAFDDLEVGLVQQVASQCAIAIRQARLYQTLQAQVAELERLNHVKDEFLNTVSYELRVPMANMKMSIEMLKLTLLSGTTNQSPPPPLSKAQLYLNILQNECDRETKLIEDLLDLQQLDTHTMTLLVSAVPLEDWLPHIIEPLRQKFQAQQLDLILEIQPDLPSLICDHVNLSRIITELLNNAYKYTPIQEKVIVSVKQDISLENPQNHWIDIEICNTGVEIPAEEIPRIFDKFYRISRLDLRRQGGTGLGLSLVQQLVTRLGGVINVTSKNLETRFTIRLPIAQSISSLKNSKASEERFN